MAKVRAAGAGAGNRNPCSRCLLKVNWVVTSSVQGCPGTALHAATSCARATPPQDGSGGGRDHRQLRSLRPHRRAAEAEQAPCNTQIIQLQPPQGLLRAIPLQLDLFLVDSIQIWRMMRVPSQLQREDKIFARWRFRGTLRSLMNSPFRSAISVSPIRLMPDVNRVGVVRGVV